MKRTCYSRKQLVILFLFLGAIMKPGILHVFTVIGAALYNGKVSIKIYGCGNVVYSRLKGRINILKSYWSTGTEHEARITPSIENMSEVSRNRNTVYFFFNFTLFFKKEV